MTNLDNPIISFIENARKHYGNSIKDGNKEYVKTVLDILDSIRFKALACMYYEESDCDIDKTLFKMMTQPNIGIQFNPGLEKGDEYEILGAISVLQKFNVHMKELNR